MGGMQALLGWEPRLLWVTGLPGSEAGFPEACFKRGKGDRREENRNDGGVRCFGGDETSREIAFRMSAFVEESWAEVSLPGRTCVFTACVHCRCCFMPARSPIWAPFLGNEG